MRSPRPLVTLLAAAVILMTAACGGGPAADATASTSTAPVVSTTSDTVTSTTQAPAAPEPQEDHTSLVARTDTELEVFATPDQSAPIHTLPATTGFGSRRALLVVDERGEWLEVLLPVRPNGSTGWIRRSDVDVREIETAVVVDLASRTLTVTEGGAVVLVTTVAIGTDASPTPTGLFSVVDKLDTAAPDGPYGPFAFGLSGFSDVLTEFAGGEGQIAIHGTNAPDSIGDAASHGCVRVPNDVATALNALLPLGTPVLIV
jgi:lipoprotein-anchoring transpeptidase ErfK/SrfK